jgi:hypothetical protein
MSRRYFLMVAFSLISTFALQPTLAHLATTPAKALTKAPPKKAAISAEAVSAADIRTNPQAPPDYDANLAVNDLAVCYLNLEPVRILAKSRGTYQVQTTSMPIVTYWFSANSVYPYFDRHEFWLTLKKYEEQVKAFLGCYAEIHNLELAKVADANYRPYAHNSTERIKLIKRYADDLAKLESELKSKLQNRPDTFLQFDKNPAIVDNIATNRQAHLQCLIGKLAGEGMEIQLTHPLTEIAKAKAKVEQFKAGAGTELYSIGVKDWGLLAVSPRERQKYFSEFKGLQEMVEVMKATGADPFAKLNAAFDDLKNSLTTKLPLYKPSTIYFQFRDPVAERVMRSKLGDPATYTLYRSGVQESGWIIDKYEIGIPRARWKHVNAYVRYKTDDHPYCRLITVYVYHEYLGGGRYNPTLMGSFPNSQLCGCP